MPLRHGLVRRWQQHQHHRHRALLLLLVVVMLVCTGPGSVFRL